MAGRRRVKAAEEDDVDDLPHTMSLREFIPHVSPRFAVPHHLASLLDAFEGVVHGHVKNGRYVVTVPMRHAKTYTCLAAMAWALYRRPQLELMYISYGANFAQRNSRKARRYAVSGGVSLSDDHNTIGEWMTTDHGVVLATGIDGEIAGRGADIIVIDDPLKSRVAAESYNERQKATDFIQEAISRLNVGGTVFLVSARWHVDDPSGQMLRTGEYEHIHHRAIEDEGLDTERALWPEVRPIEALKRTRHEVGESNWYSWYQGEPRPPDANLFRTPPATYSIRPEGLQLSIGIDLGFTKNGDASEAIVVGRSGSDIYILDRRSWQKRIPEVASGLAELVRAYPSAPLFQYVSGPEVGTIDLLREFPYKIDIIGVPARYNKFVRAMGVADAWNGGRVRVPAVATWDVKSLCTQALNFTGEDGGTDNAVDALVAAYDALEGGGASALDPGFYGRRSW